ncbi:MAG: hypothetical protein SFU83_13655 [Meiothermus sp.]|nr:hypothetical protein [Meiothermus sp.]
MIAGMVELLELYEYKVADLSNGVEPKGGHASITRLRQTLMQSNLPGPLAKKFREIDARFKAQRPGQKTTSEEAPLEFEAIFLDEDSADSSPERLALDKLTEMVYWAHLERDLSRSSKQFSQGKRDEMRLIYAVLQNLESYSATPQFAQDFNLSKFSLSHAIPALTDPRMQLDDGQVGTTLLLEFFRQAEALSAKLRLPPEETVPYLKRFARRVLDSEGALKTSSKGPSVDMLRRAVDEAKRQRLAPTEIKQLEDRLSATAAEDRRMALVLEDDRNRFGGAIERVADLLSKHLPAPKGQAQWPQIQPKILGGLSPKYAVTQVPDGQKGLTLRLRPQRFRFYGQEIGISQTGQVYGLSVAEQERTLEDGSPFFLLLPDAELWVFRYGEYIHLRVEPREAATLSNLQAEGRALAHLLWPEQDFAYLRLMRALSARFKGEVAYNLYSPDSAAKYAEAPIDSLQDFARKGLEVVKGRIQRAPQWVQYLHEVAKVMGLEDYAPALQRELSEWLGFHPPSRDTLAGDIGSTTVGDQPASIRAGNLILTLRYSDDSIYVSNTGSVPRRLQDLMVWNLPDGALVLAREGARVAHATVYIQSKARAGSR